MKLDLCGIYKMVFMHEGDDAVTFDMNNYEYLVMLSVLCNIPATFQHFYEYLTGYAAPICHYLP